MDIKLFILIISFAATTISQNQCGISDFRFVGSDSLAFNGRLAEDGQWPWAAALYYKDGNSRRYYCSGTLIDSQHVLTGEKN
jgi:secreted trypsin-like serine protease